MENTFNVEAFDPTTSELKALVEKTKDINASDLEDKGQMAVIKEHRILLKNARIKIEKTGKGLRDDAVKFQKAVIAKEKELIGIIEPEEERLASIEEEAKALAIRKERLLLLPERNRRMAELNLMSPTPLRFPLEEEILLMDSQQFEAMFLEKIAEKNENIRLQVERDQEEKAKKLDEERRKLDEEKAKIESDKKIKEAKEQAEKDTEARLKKEADEKAENDRKEAERLETEKKLEAAKLQKRKDYIDFLKSYGWTEETKHEFKVVEENDSYVLYKKLGVFEK